MNKSQVLVLKIFASLIFPGLTGITINGMPETYVYAGF